MRCRLSRIAAFAVLVFAHWGSQEASAGLVTYGWGPLVGGGYDVTYPGNQFIPYTTNDGSVVVGYDPDNLTASYIDFSAGAPGYQVTADRTFQVTVLSDGVMLSAVGDDGQSASVSLFGDPGPLNLQGLPVSLGNFAGGEADVGAHAGYHAADQFVFGGQVVPEPSSLVTLALGIGGLMTASAARRAKERLGPRWLNFSPARPAHDDGRPVGSTGRLQVGP